MSTMTVGEEIEFTAIGKDQTRRDRSAREPDLEPRRIGNRRAGPLIPASGSDTTIFTATTPGSPPGLLPRRRGHRRGARDHHRSAALDHHRNRPGLDQVDVDGQVDLHRHGQGPVRRGLPPRRSGVERQRRRRRVVRPQPPAPSTTFTATYPGACTVSCTQGDVDGHRRGRDHGRRPAARDHRAEPGDGADPGRGRASTSPPPAATSTAGPSTLADPVWRDRGRRRRRLRPRRAAAPPRPSPPRPPATPRSSAPRTGSRARPTVDDHWPRASRAEKGRAEGVAVTPITETTTRDASRRGVRGENRFQFF